MPDRPIIFSAPMVKALLAGCKTQTRRVLSIRGHRSFSEFGPSDTKGYDWHFRDGGARWHDLRDTALRARLAYAPGDRLWVRECFASDRKHLVAYRADGECGAWCWDGEGKPLFIRHGSVLEVPPGGQFGMSRYGARWRSPIHMPRWASRLTLTVTDVRVQRVQEISEGDARAEGVELREAFRDLWKRIHGPDAWDRNDWIAAVTFKAERG